MDPEIDAMGKIAAALEPLEQDAVRRVLKWAIERYQPRPGQAGAIPGGIEAAAIPSSATPSRTFLNLSELFDAANPDTGLDKVLVVAYWFQQLQHEEEWESQSLNTQLKHLGHPSSNITRDLDSLISRSPRYVLQTRKEGTTKQARKRYKLTREGIRAVEAMLSRTAPLAG